MAKVTLISHTPNPEKIISACAKLCYSKDSANEILNSLTDEKIASFVDMLASIGHESPIEHVSFTFAVEQVSRSLLAQLTRHRIASYSVKSQRYVSEDGFEYIIPPEIEKIPEAKDEYLRAMDEANNHYLNLTSMLKSKHEKDFLSKGFNPKSAAKLASKKAIEDARFVLPNACETKLICTMNARSLLNFFSHRCCNRAQWEIRDLAIDMLKLVTEVAPNLFKNAGPPCLRGNCPEGKMSCGEMSSVKLFFEELKTHER